MSLVFVSLLAASPAILPQCSWDRPDVNPFQGDVVAAVERYQDIPVDARRRLQARMGKLQHDDIVTIRRDQIVGKGDYDTEVRDMHFGAGQLCQSVSRSNWTDAFEVRGLVYCEDKHCVVVPSVHHNVSRIGLKVARPAGSGGFGAAVGAPSLSSLLPQGHTIDTVANASGATGWMAWSGGDMGDWPETAGGISPGVDVEATAQGLPLDEDRAPVTGGATPTVQPLSADTEPRPTWLPDDVAAHQPLSTTAPSQADGSPVIPGAASPLARRAPVRAVRPVIANNPVALRKPANPIAIRAPASARAPLVRAVATGPTRVTPPRRVIPVRHAVVRPRGAVAPTGSQGIAAPVGSQNAPGPQVVTVAGGPVVPGGAGSPGGGIGDPSSLRPAAPPAARPSFAQGPVAQGPVSENADDGIPSGPQLLANEPLEDLLPPDDPLPAGRSAEGEPQVAALIAPAAVPEPSTALLGVVALLALSTRRKSRPGTR